MDVTAAGSSSDRRDLFQETANRRGLSPLVIEKDFWVCWTLKRLFALPSLGPHLIFKSGTSLSKVFRLIQRFSEDIDVSLRSDYLGFDGDNDSENAASKNQQRNRVQARRAKCRLVVQQDVKEALAAAFERVLGAGGWALEGDPEDENTLNFTYPHAIASDAPGAAYIQRLVKLEMGASLDPYPIGAHSIQPYAAEEFPSIFTAPDCAASCSSRWMISGGSKVNALRRNGSSSRWQRASATVTFMSSGRIAKSTTLRTCGSFIRKSNPMRQSHASANRVKSLWISGVVFSNCSG